MKKESVLGINVSILKCSELINAICDDIREGRKRSIIAINPEKILEAKKSDKFARLINNADYQIADGIGILLASKLKKGQISHRTTGIDVMEKLCNISSQNQFKVFLYGAASEVVMKVRDTLKYRYPQINIVGIIDGFSFNENVIDIINEACPDILFVALGSPKQEYWIMENRDKLDVKIVQGVGGSFDIISGKLKRSPIFFRRFGLEWLYRLITQPKRISRDIKLLKYIYLVLTDKGARE